MKCFPPCLKWREAFLQKEFLLPSLLLAIERVPSEVIADESLLRDTTAKHLRNYSTSSVTTDFAGITTTKLSPLFLAPLKAAKATLLG